MEEEIKFQVYRVKYQAKSGYIYIRRVIVNMGESPRRMKMPAKRAALYCTEDK